MFSPRFACLRGVAPRAHKGRGGYAATGGGMSPAQGKLLKSTVNGWKSLKTIILITDNDQGGDRLSDKVRDIIATSDFSGEIKRHSPQKIGQDWNNVLKVK